MISQIALSKITTKSKNLKWDASRGYHPIQESSVPYAEKIVVHEGKPYLVHENMIFTKGSIDSSSYTVYEFDEEGDFMGEVDTANLPDNFFYTIELIAEI